MKGSLHIWLLALALTAAGLALPARAGELTAFDLVKDGNRYVSEDVRDQVVKITSDKSSGTLAPTVWSIIYYDSDAAFRATEVTYSEGKKVDVKRPMRMFQFGTSDEKRLDHRKLNLDSDQALAIAARDSSLANLKLVASELTLEHSDLGPIWKVRLWAAKTKNTSDDADLGTVQILADDGTVVKRDLHPDRVN
jgi:hypothetical protein